MDQVTAAHVLSFKKLRLTGFKSFVDPTELLIERGLTGVVGPNGCGKSNLVEALKWVMGETSAKQMRGSGMEDVIFSGTAERPSRNVAEVTLTLDNQARIAPPRFNEFDELEISRRIERDKGSTYRINGQEVRARDVQLLFADQATGARSTALVSQGRIGTVINAKPAQRRLLLEEAAGITGLHSRRHEAELRLKGAETNLERLDDILMTLETQMNSLRKQARQATRYRNLSDHIRKAEATLFYVRWQAAEAEQSESRTRFKDADAAVRELTLRASQASTLQASASDGLPELRQAEAEVAAELQRLLLARENLDQEEQRARDAAEENRRRQEQAGRDLERERALLADASAAERRLDDEQATITQAQEGETEDLAQASEALEKADAEVAEREGELNQLTEDVANSEARRTALTRRVDELEQRNQRLVGRRQAAEAEKNDLETKSADLVDLAEAETHVDQARDTLETAREAREAAAADSQAAQAHAEELTAASREAGTKTAGLEAEVRALADLLATSTEGGTPVLDDIKVAPGLEDALGAALGDDLDAPLDEEADIHWRQLPPLEEASALPAGADPLAPHVDAPAALARRLAQTGVVGSADQAARLQAGLRPGQRLVSRAGGLWRWDGYTVNEGAETAAAKRLAQRNRLAELEDQLTEARRAQADAETRGESALAARTQALEAEQTARTAVRDADIAFNTARDTLSEIKDRAAAVQTRLAALEETIAGIVQDIDETATAKEDASGELATLDDTSAARARLETLRAQLAESRARQVESRSRHSELTRAAEGRRARLVQINDERQMWQSRKKGAEGQVEELDRRRQDLAAELTALESRPGEIAEKRESLAGAIEDAEARRKNAADTLAEAEGQAREVEKALRLAEQALAQAREQRVRAEGAVDQAEQACRALIERIQERLQVRPEGLARLAEIDDAADLPELEAIERKVDRLHRERDTMGPVNLRAEQEMRELSEQIETLGQEKEDLLAAIDKLRQGIQALNREGRARLLASFAEVNEHFQKLFVRLYGGGRAHLELVESDDPLEAGLEIFASPPGKRLQVLSLLSGGEQALTALALLFAVFQTNPAPICVLDEVDAPLDDANVDRFCKMVEEMSGGGQTRFMIITHHRMTMSRMSRLFGVTMQERGVSQLVSVDLQRAEELRATA